MPPQATTTRPPGPTPTPTAGSGDWTDFINTIGTAVGPLITLFGEQATKQFVSVSMGWADNILLSMGPIGIITVIVSAIRVGGYRWLKSILGRARESRAIVEQEFLSSTSQETCELWSGREIVRVSGKPSDHGIKNVFVLSTDTAKLPLSNASDSHARRFLKQIRSSDVSGLPGPEESASSLHYRGLKEIETAQWDYGLLCAVYPDTPLHEIVKLLNTDLLLIKPDVDTQAKKDMALDAPNLTLNVQGTIRTPEELYFWALVGVVLQSSTVAFPAIVQYHWKWLRKGVAIPTFAYGCFVTRTVCIVVGLLICGRIIESCTTEHTIEPTAEGNMLIQRIFRLQMACTVGSQRFPSVGIVNPQDNMLIRTSRLDLQRINSPKTKLLSAIGSFLAMAGFIVQFVGLGTMHWSATIVVLVVSIAMTGVRAWVRRGLTGDPICMPLPEGNELIFTALRMLRNDWNKWSKLDDDHMELSSLGWDGTWGILTGSVKPLGELSIPEQKSHELEVLRNGANDFFEQVQRSSPEGLVLGFVNWTEHRLQCSEIRAMKDLMSIMPNVPAPSDCVDLASKLAAAIIKIKVSLSSSPDIHWKEDDHTSSWLHRPLWKVDVRGKAKEKTPWIVRIDSEKGLADDLTAGLSLWTYFLSCASNSLGRLYNDRVNTYPGKYGFFRRIVGNSEMCSMDELQSWLPRLDRLDIADVLKSVPSYDGKWNPEDFRWEDYRVKSWSIFGMYYSSSFKMYTDPCCDSGLKSFTFESVENGSESQDFVLLKLQSTLERECALEILVLFMLTACMHMESVRGSIEVIERDNGQPYLKSSVFEDLAKIIGDAGVATIPNAALLYIVLAFARCKLLPTFDPHDVLSLLDRIEKASPSSHPTRKFLPTEGTFEAQEEPPHDLLSLLDRIRQPISSAQGEDSASGYDSEESSSSWYSQSQDSAPDATSEESSRSGGAQSQGSASGTTR
ncbi:hypothetical protein K402DRAFT_466280 [Aulographum hederae CBS 113979]|uniref:Uncharacterized protein n=1 Tax=Aulographum hederae CBS 113979 TaxID=1176131 RepID=A0A6G1GQE9_9PEZI|nr:hypothetical protein K402DRAFT_466280 [Aulographum hederae CBS 113979]